MLFYTVNILMAFYHLLLDYFEYKIRYICANFSLYVVYSNGINIKLFKSVNLLFQKLLLLL